MKAILLLAVLALACQAPPVQVGFEMTDTRVCITVDPDSTVVGPLRVNVDGDKIIICYDLEP